MMVETVAAGRLHRRELERQLHHALRRIRELERLVEASEARVRRAWALGSWGKPR